MFESADEPKPQLPEPTHLPFTLIVLGCEVSDKLYNRIRSTCSDEMLKYGPLDKERTDPNRNPKRDSHPNLKECTALVAEMDTSIGPYCATLSLTFVIWH